MRSASDKGVLDLFGCNLYDRQAALVDAQVNDAKHLAQQDACTRIPDSEKTFSIATSCGSSDSMSWLTSVWS